MVTATRSDKGIRGRFERFIDERIPPAHRVDLSQKNIFIFPTRTGFVFSLLLVLLILGAINYQNSLVYGVAFLLGAMFLVTILYTFRNLSQLSVELVAANQGFLGEEIGFEIRLQRPKHRPREGIQIGWPVSIQQWADLIEQEADVVRLYVKSTRRGWLNPGRLLIETRFPLGLLRAWTWVDLNAAGLVYPAPIFDDFPMARSGSLEEGELVDPQGSEDFREIRNYHPGDPVKHILWRTYARSDDLQVKEYASYLEPRYWLDFGEVGGDVEQRLSRLTGLALTANQENREFGLKLPGVTVPPGIGKAHLEQVLAELAVHGL